MRKSLLALLVVAAVAASAEATFLGKAFTLLPGSPWKLDVGPGASGAGTAVTVLEIRGAALGVLDNFTAGSGVSISRSYKALPRGTDRIVITFDQANQSCTAMVRITQDNPSSTFGPPNKFESLVLGDHGQWVLDVAH